MAFWAAAIPIAQAVGGMLMKDDAQKKNQQMMVQKGGGVNMPKPSETDMSDAMGAAVGVMQGAKGLSGTQSQALDSKMIQQNPGEAINKARDIFKRNPDLGQRYGVYIDEWEKKIS